MHCRVHILVPFIAMTIARDGEKFSTQFTGHGPAEILAYTEDKFFAVVVDAQICFEKGADGKMNQLVLLQGGRDTPAKRTHLERN